MVRLDNIKIRENLEIDDVVRRACLKNKIDYNSVKEFRIVRKSIDARNKNDIFFNYIVDIEVENEEKYRKLKKVVTTENSLKVKVKNKEVRKTCDCWSRACWFICWTGIC